MKLPPDLFKVTDDIPTESLIPPTPPPTSPPPLSPEPTLVPTNHHEQSHYIEESTAETSLMNDITFDYKSISVNELQPNEASSNEFQFTPPNKNKVHPNFCTGS